MQATLPWSIHYLKADTLHSKTIHYYQPELVKSCSLVKIKIPYPATFPLQFSHPDPLITQNPAPAINWNSRSPLPFSAPIPNIATKINQIPHPAKPIVDRRFGVKLRIDFGLRSSCHFCLERGKSLEGDTRPHTLRTPNFPEAKRWRKYRCQWRRWSSWLCVPC